MALVLFVAAALALDISPVGTINDDLFAPTSLYVQDDELAVLEPYARQLKIFSADGVFSHALYLTGDAYGLTKTSRYVYLYCDRDRRAVVAVNAVNGDQFDYFPDLRELQDPVDLLARDSAVWVLDAGNSSILILSERSAQTRRLTLTGENGDPLQYVSSFAYDAVRQRIYLLDQVHSRVLVTGADGNLIDAFSGFGSGEGEITRGGEIALDGLGRVYVSDRFQGRVSVFSPDGAYLGEIDAFAGTVAVPTGIAVDNNGVLYVASTMGAGIRMFFVSATPSLDESVTIIQRYPETDATLRVEDVRLAALAGLGNAAPEVTGFDFQLFADTLDAPVAEAVALPPVEEVDESSSSRRFSAEWVPDTGLVSERTYGWRLRLRSDSEVGRWSDFRLFHTASLPRDYRLDQNFPNPFNPTTNISFSVPVDVEVTLEVYNMLGQKVATLVDGRLPAGNHTVSWNGKTESGQSAATGVYFYRLRSDDFSQTRKMVLIK